MTGSVAGTPNGGVAEYRYMNQLSRPMALATALLFAASPASAATVSDPAGDYLASYTGAKTTDLDLISASVTLDGANFLLSATTAGPITNTPGQLYVFGINRGAGLPRLAPGAPPAFAEVLFDAVAVLFPDGLARVATFPVAGAPTITPLPGAANVSGASISAAIPLSLLPSTGFASGNYTFTLWSRLRVNPAADGSNAEIADFAPALTAGVPEPTSWAMMVLGFGLAGAATRRRTAERRTFA